MVFAVNLMYAMSSNLDEPTITDERTESCSGSDASSANQEEYVELIFALGVVEDPDDVRSNPGARMYAMGGLVADLSLLSSMSPFGCPRVGKLDSQWSRGLCSDALGFCCRRSKALRAARGISA